MQLIKQKIMEEYLPYIRQMWNASDCSFPDFLESVPIEMRWKNEEYLNQNLQSLKKVSKSSKKNALSDKQKEMLEKKIEKILEQETILNIHEAMDAETMCGFKAGIKDFLRKARKFAPELEMEGIGQAVRNYMVHAVFNELHGCPQVCSSASFGYSMLYPVTDNFIDDDKRSVEEKKQYNQLIYDKIAGNEISDTTDYGKKTCDLLQAIEDQYPREQDTEIYTLLWMMLDAQDKSMQQQQGNQNLSNGERLEISAYKGGISVLIDRYFVNCRMTKEDYEFYLGFGLYLQLADDLQDITEDANNHGQTLFTSDLSPESEELIVNRLFHFLNHLFQTHHFQQDAMKEFLLKSCYQLIITSAMGSKKHFREEYINRLEACMPVSSGSVERMKQELSENREDFSTDTCLGMLDAMLA